MAPELASSGPAFRQGGLQELYEGAKQTDAGRMDCGIVLLDLKMAC